MPNRAERRAAERASHPQLAVAASTNTEPQTMSATAAVGGVSVDSPESSSSSVISEAQLAANRANAKLSCGPRTESGKLKSSLNAVKTGLTGRTILLPTDDVAIYQQHVDRIINKYAPTNDDEKALVQSIADTEWRLLRIAPLEAGFYALGRKKLADQITDESDPAAHEALLQTEIFNLYRKELTNLALQERRLRNHRKDDIAELEKLRCDAKARSQKRFEQAVSCQEILNVARRENLTLDWDDFGFEFSKAEIEAYWQKAPLHRRLTGRLMDFDRFLSRYRASANSEAQAA